jgi:hypothetical protein|tara:strand:+ start:739 stop:1017 length:279 start_codon:yes stop_codon:yes gene_type:complete
MGLLFEVLRRTSALILLRVSGTFAGGSIAGVELWQSAAVAAFIGIMDVAENLSRAYMIDGRLDMEEINTAFGAQAVSDEDKAMAESIQEEVK